MTGPVDQYSDGTGNVQLAGIYNSTIVIGRGGGRLPLERAATPLPRRVRSPALLLHARYGVVPFVGRTGLRDALADWTAASESFSVRVVAGQGGLGKTRLAVDLCTASGAGGWTCGFLRPGANEEGLDRLAGEAAPRLVVVDYAEARVGALTALAEALPSAATAATPVRVLLLVRRGRDAADAADPRWRWLQPLTGLSAALDAWLDEAELDVLEELDVAGRRRLGDVAIAAFARHLGLPVPESPPLATGSPLRVVLSALLAVQDDAPARGADLFHHVLKHEDHYWQQRATELELTLGPRARRLVAAVATLVAPQRRDDALGLLRLLDDFRDAPAERLGALAEWAHGLYPGPAYWNPLEPDLVGESLVAEMLGDDVAATERLVAAGGERPLTVLSRLVATGRRAPAALEALSYRLDTLGSWELFSLAQAAGDQPAASAGADRLVGELRARLRMPEAEAQGPIGQYGLILQMGLESIASAGHVPIAARLAALDGLTSRLDDDGHPWRLQDWARGEWRQTALGGALLDVLASEPEATVAHLTGWLGDDAPVTERGSDVSRQTIAMAVLSVSADALPEAWWRRLADDDPHLFGRVAGHAADRKPRLLTRHALRWSQENDVTLLHGALAVARQLPDDEVISRVKVLQRLFRAAWPGRLTAAVMLAQDLPESEELRTHLVEAVLEGRLDPLYLRRYQGDAPEVVVGVLEQLAEAGRRTDVLTEIARWAAPPPAVEERLLALVPAVGEEHSVAGVVEYALYALNGGEPVSEARLRLAERFLDGDHPREEELIGYGLSLPPLTEPYRAARRRLAAVACAAPVMGPRTQLLRAVLRRQDAPPDSPEDEYTSALITGLGPADLREVLLAVLSATLSDRVVPFALRTIATAVTPVDPALATFARVHRETGDKYAALRAAYGLE